MGSRSSSEEDREFAEQFIKEAIKNHQVVVFSKSHCPYCKMAKSALNDAGAEYFVVEVETRKDGAAIQDVLLQMTGARTVPRVFINRKFIGGGSETKEMAANGELKKLLEA